MLSYLKIFKGLTFILLLLVISFTPLDALQTSEESGVTYGRYFFFAMLVSAIISQDIKLKNPLFVKILVLFILWAFATVIWSVDPDNTLFRCLYLIQYFFIVIVMLNVLNSQSKLAISMWGWIFGAVYIAYLSIVDFRINSELEGSLYRVDSFGNPNENSFILCYALLFCYIIDKTRFRIPSIIFTFISIFAIIANGSRMGTILFIVTLLSFVLYQMKGKNKYYLFIIIIPLLVYFILNIMDSIPVATMERMSGITQDIEEGDLSHREEIWEGGIQALSEHPLWLLFGSGWGSFHVVINQYLGEELGTHNFFLDVLGTTGIIGFSILIYYLYTLLQTIKSTNKASILNYMLLIIPLISMTSTNWQSRRWWFLMGAFIYLIYKTDNFQKDDLLSEEANPDGIISNEKE